MENICYNDVMMTFNIVFCFYIHFLQPRTPDQVHKFRCTTQPAPGKTRIFYGRYDDPKIADILTHGVSTRPSYVVRVSF